MSAPSLTVAPPPARRYRSRFGNRGKYNAQKTEYPPGSGEVYDSKLEAKRAADLDLLLAAGRIAGWRRGREWRLIDQPHPRFPKKRLKMVYTPDFEVWTLPDRSDRWLEDTKGTQTRDFRMRVVLMAVVHPTVRLKVITKDGAEKWV